MPMYEVALITREQINYIVEAESPEAAEELVQDKYSGDLPGGKDAAVTLAPLGNEWSEIEKIVVRPISEVDHA